MPSMRTPLVRRPGQRRRGELTDRAPRKRQAVPGANARHGRTAPRDCTVVSNAACSRRRHALTVSYRIGALPRSARVRGSSCSSPPPSSPCSVRVRSFGNHQSCRSPGVGPRAPCPGPERSSDEPRALPQFQPSAEQPARPRLPHVRGGRQRERSRADLRRSGPREAPQERRSVLHQLYDAASGRTIPLSIRVAHDDGALLSPRAQDCLQCGRATRGVCHPFFRFIEFRCAACGSEWTLTLTAEQRWTLLHGLG